MNRGIYWWICLTTLAVSVCGAAIGAARWLGPDDLVRSLAWLGHAPLFAGCLAPTLVYALVQSLPGGRTPFWIMRPPSDGWTLVLVTAMLCAILAGFPTLPGGPNHILLDTPFALTASIFTIDRMRRVQRQLAASGFPRPS